MYVYVQKSVIATYSSKSSSLVYDHIQNEIDGDTRQRNAPSPPLAAPRPTRGGRKKGRADKTMHVTDTVVQTAVRRKDKVGHIWHYTR